MDDPRERTARSQLVEHRRRWPPATSSRPADPGPPIRSTGTAGGQELVLETAGHAAAVVGDHDPPLRHQPGSFAGQGGLDRLSRGA